jgi:hypothetical protein
MSKIDLYLVKVDEKELYDNFKLPGEHKRLIPGEDILSFVLDGYEATILLKDGTKICLTLGIEYGPMVEVDGERLL